MSFGMYLIGFFMLIVGLALGAHIAGVPSPYIGLGSMVLAGFGVLGGLKTTRMHDRSGI